MTGGSQQLRLYRRARRDNNTVATACVLSGISMTEARLIEAEDLRNPPPDEAYELLSPAPSDGAQSKEEDMAKKAKPGDSGGDRVTNLTETKAVIRDAVANLVRIDGERAELNAEAAEYRAKVKNCGVPVAALNLAIRMKKADPEDRQAMDEGYAIARDAIGLRFQASLFETLDEDLSDKRPASGDVTASALN